MSEPTSGLGGSSNRGYRNATESASRLFARSFFGAQNIQLCRIRLWTHGIQKGTKISERFSMRRSGSTTPSENALKSADKLQLAISRLGKVTPISARSLSFPVAASFPVKTIRSSVLRAFLALPFRRKAKSGRRHLDLESSSTRSSCAAVRL